MNSKTAIIFFLTVLLVPVARDARSQESPETAGVRLTVHLVHGTDQGSGDKFDGKTRKLEAALGRINRNYFRSLKEVKEPMLFGEPHTFALISDRLTVTVETKSNDQYPVELAWKKSDGSNHVKMKVHLAPKKLFALQGTPYQNGNLWAVLRIEEGSFPLSREKGPSGSAEVPPFRSPVKAGGGDR
jgi:hypothetical protein